MKANVNGINLYYETHGTEGPWLTLSHSLGCSSAMWTPQIAEFSKRFRVLAFDTRGHGRSDAPQGPYTLEQLADDLAGLLAQLGIQQTHFCGLSMGGMIGQTFALKYPRVFSSLTLANTTSRYPAEAQSTWADRIRIVESQGMQPLLEPTLGRWFTPAFREARPDIMKTIGAQIVATPAAGYAGCCAAIPQIDVTKRLGEIKCPILVIAGEQDMATPLAMAQEMHTNAPGSTLAVLSPAAHLSNLEQPEAFSAALDGVRKRAA